MRLFGFFDDDDDISSSSACGGINPANGLPMMDDSCTIDIMGNTYGTDSSSIDSLDISPTDDLFSDPFEDL